MSWAGTCKDLITRYPSLRHVCITDLEGNIWGTSDPSFEPTTKVVQEAMNLMKGCSEATSLEIADTKYIIIRSDASNVICKSGKRSCFLSKTGRMCIIGMSEDTDTASNSGNANNSMGKIAEYYISTGY